MGVINESKSLEAQNAVLGSILISPEITGDVLSQAYETDFTGSNKAVYKAIKTLFLTNSTIDPVTVLSKTGNEYHQHIRDLMIVTPTAANYKAYLRVLKDQTLVRTAQEVGSQLAEASSPEEARELIDGASQLLTSRQSNWKKYSMEDLLHRFFDKYEHKPDYLDWGISALNKQVYADSGDFIVIGGRPSVGKTAFAIEVAINLARTKKVGFFSFETGPDKFIDRVVSSSFRVDLGKIQERTIPEQDWMRIGNAADAFCAQQVTFVHASGMTPDDIKSLTLADRYDVIFVDYLQIVNSGLKNAMSVEQTRAISMGLHNLAQSCGVTVIALAQLKRPDTRERADRAPTLIDLKESGQIEQDADTIMFLYRQNAGERNSPRKLKVAKNKEGKCGTTTLIFEGRYQHFTEAGCNADDDLSDEELSEYEPEQIPLDDDDYDPARARIERARQNSAKVVYGKGGRR